MPPVTAKETKFQKYLASIDAHWTARDWAGERSAKQAWEESPYADLLLRWAAMAGIEHKLIVRCVCQCARWVLPQVTIGELEPLKAIETAEAWCEGIATLEDITAAIDAVHLARKTDRGPEGGPLTAADYAAYAAAHAASTAYTVEVASNVAVSAGYAHAMATLEANDLYDCSEDGKAMRAIAAVFENIGLCDSQQYHQKAMCAIVREMIPFPGLRHKARGRSRPAAPQQQQTENQIQKQRAV